MAIKIKKKDNSKTPEVEVEVLESEEEEQEVDIYAGNVDPFERKAMSTASWVEKNPAIVFGGVALVLAAIIGFYFFQEGKKKEAIATSSELNSVFEDFVAPIKGSPELEALEKVPSGPKPKKTFDDMTKKWTAIYDASSKGLTSPATAQSARLAKASAATKLGKYDEAVTLYNAFLGATHDKSSKGPVLQGLASAQIGAKKYDEAIATLAKLKGLDEGFAASATYQHARILEWQNKKEDAKKLYHEVLEKNPQFNKKSDVERRLATLDSKDAPKLAPKVVKAEYTSKLSTGFELKGASNGIESKLVGFVSDAARPVDTKTWFDFDRLTFNTGSAALNMAKSKSQLSNIFEVFKAFPKVKAKLGGYTDNTGDAKKNVTLSQKRADNVVAQLVKMGVDKSRLEAEGYGSAHPVCAANDTPECRRQNRRISLRVTEK